MALGLPTNFSYSLSKSLNDPKNKKFVDFTRKNQQKQKADKLRQQQAIDRVGQDKYNQGWVKFGNDKLNINTTSAKGLEKGIGVIARFIIKVQGKVNEIFYGKFTSGRESRNLIKRLLNKGIIKLLEGIASIDLCDILNYAISQIPAGKLFDPNNRPNSDDSLALKKWYVQKAAFDTQKFIDDYYRDYLDNNNPQSKVGLFVLIQNIKQTLGDTVLSPTSGINDPLLRKNFPQLGNANNFLQNGFSLIDRYTDVRQINNEEAQRIISTIDKIRQYCILIQALNSPKDAISFVDSSLNLGIREELADWSKLILNPEKTAIAIRSVVKSVNTINDIGQKLLGYIQTLQVITKICILLIQIFNVISAFFVANPFPGLLSTLGLNTKVSSTYENVVQQKGKKKLITRLQQISAVIDLMAILVTSIVAAVQNIILKLQVMILNLESCSNPDIDLIKEIDNTVISLTKTSQGLQDFLDRYNNQQKAAESLFGGYTISIVTEEVVDEGINLKRRYGIAKDANQYVVVQSTPTFASLDLIIINEVKVLLVSKGLVNTGLSSLSADDQVTVTNAAAFLGIDDVNLDNITLDLTDLESFNDTDDELGLSSFVNNLPGGRALRRRVREKMIKNARSLGTSLKGTDPQGKFTSGLQAQQNKQVNQLEIQNLQDKIKDWKRDIALAATQGVVGLAIIRDRTLKIKEAEKKIQQLRQG